MEAEFGVVNIFLGLTEESSLQKLGEKELAGTCPIL